MASADNMTDGQEGIEGVVSTPDLALNGRGDNLGLTHQGEGLSLRTRGSPRPGSPTDQSREDRGCEELAESHNSLYYGLPAISLDRLQKVQNSLARAIDPSVRRHHHITSYYYYS